ncbi:MAG: flavin reductase [Actinobacteria bacterium]|nr:flavin reductase [Actinomycetota bacterium]
MSSFPTGVAVVTSLDTAGEPQGMTCTSLLSVTLRPPTLLVSLRHGSATLAAVIARGVFSVNLLHAGAREIAELFSRPVESRFSRVSWRLSAHGAPWLVDAALGVADCSVVGATDVRDHRLVFGEVRHVSVCESDALLYGRRRFGSWAVPAPDVGGRSTSGTGSAGTSPR